MTNLRNEFLWVEKYRPKKIEECILSNDLRKTFSNIVAGGELQNMMLTGTAGTGKTTVARALCNELDLDYIVINGSEESGIDTLRNRIVTFLNAASKGAENVPEGEVPVAEESESEE